MNKVKMYRTGAGYSQEQMAKVLSISINSYRNKEEGVTEFTKSEMVAFLKEMQKKDAALTLDKIFLD